MDERCAICGRRGTNGAGPSQDTFAALSDRHIDKIVIASINCRVAAASGRPVGLIDGACVRGKGVTWIRVGKCLFCSMARAARSEQLASRY
jgi:hypothetical protein